MSQHTYDVKNVAVICGGFPLYGFSEDTKVSVEFPESWTKVVGCDGIVTRCKTNNGTATMTLSVAQASAANDILSGLATADDTAPGGVTFPVLVKDINGRTLITALNGWISQKPTVEFGAEAGVREWIVDLGDTIGFVGGN